MISGIFANPIATAQQVRQLRADTLRRSLTAANDDPAPQASAEVPSASVPKPLPIHSSPQGAAPGIFSGRDYSTLFPEPPATDPLDEALGTAANDDFPVAANDVPPPPAITKIRA